MKVKFVYEGIKTKTNKYRKDLMLKSSVSKFNSFTKIDPLFVHFSDTPEEKKFGINMQYYYSTIMGIYAYRSTQDILNWANPSVNIDASIPYGKFKHYIHFFTLKPDANILYTSKYKKRDLRRDVGRLRGLYRVTTPEDEDDNDFINRQIKRTMKSFNYRPFEKLIKIIDSLFYNSQYSQKRSKYLNIILRKLGYDGIIDNGYMLSRDIKEQCVFFSIKPIIYLGSIPNYNCAKFQEFKTHQPTKTTSLTLYKTGDKVKIIDGKYKDYKGIVKSIQKGRLIITLKIFGWIKDVVLNRNLVSKIE